MLTPRLVRPLTLDAQHHPRGQPHLSAASGIVHVGAHLYIVADDEHHLARLDARDPQGSAIELVRFAPGELPQEKEERKRRKPDVEVLLQVPADVAGGRGLLVLLGSGSRPPRERAFAAAVDEAGRLQAAREIRAADFYAPLVALFGEVNIEAATIDDARLYLFQRANRGQPQNARIAYDARDFVRWLGAEAQAPRSSDVLSFSLGAQEGVPFGITDATPLAGGGCVFTAVAENTADAYRDGACLASLVGWMDPGGSVRAIEHLAGAPKVEGIADAGDGSFWLVTDTDDPQHPSLLLELAVAPPVPAA